MYLESSQDVLALGEWFSGSEINSNKYRFHDFVIYMIYDIYDTKRIQTMRMFHL